MLQYSATIPNCIPDCTGEPCQTASKGDQAWQSGGARPLALSGPGRPSSEARTQTGFPPGDRVVALVTQAAPERHTVALKVGSDRNCSAFNTIRGFGENVTNQAGP